MDTLDEALAELPRHDAPEWAIQEILARVEADRASEQVEPPVAPTATLRMRAGWIGLAAGLALGLGILWATTQRGPESSAVVSHGGMTLKGAALAPVDPSISLGLSLLRDDVPVALVPGASALGTDTVLLRYTTDSSGFAYLFRLGPDDELEVFHGTPTLPGTHHVTVDDRIVGYDLAGLAGEHIFGVAFSQAPWAPGRGATAEAPAGLAQGIAARGAFPRTIGEVRVDAVPVRLGARP